MNIRRVQHVNNLWYIVKRFYVLGWITQIIIKKGLGRAGDGHGNLKRLTSFFYLLKDISKKFKQLNSGY